MPSMRTTTRLVYLIFLLSETERTETQYIDGKVCVVKRSFFCRAAARARGGRGNASIPSEREEVSRGRGGEETHGSEATRDAGIYAIRAVVGTREKCANGVGEVRGGAGDGHEERPRRVREDDEGVSIGQRGREGRRAKKAEREKKMAEKEVEEIERRIAGSRGTVEN